MVSNESFLDGVRTTDQPRAHQRFSKPKGNRRSRKKQRQGIRWKSMNGPVVTSKIEEPPPDAPDAVQSFMNRYAKKGHSPGNVTEGK